MKDKDIIVLLNFLKSGFSTRKLDKLLGYSNTKGWKSWEILKKYELKNEDKGKLFLYSAKQSREIILQIMKEQKENYIDFLIKNNPPKNLKKYVNTYVLAESEKSFYNIFSGETRNIIRDFFNPEKKLIGKCQFKGCHNKESQIDTVHYSKDRPSIFIKCANKFKTKSLPNLFRYDIYKTMKCFLEAHSKEKSVCFLCKNHHNEFHKLEKSNKSDLRDFKKNIIF